MIYTALHYVVQQLDEFLKLRFSEQSTTAILGTILNESGSVPEENQNKIIISLMNIEQEAIHPYATDPRRIGDKGIIENEPYNFNMDILVSSLFNDYGESLKFLSESIYFFQSKQVFTPENSPGLDPKIDKLSFELIKLDYAEMQNLWTALGSRYLPSVLFKVRMLSFQSDQITGVNPIISGVDNPTKPAS